MIHEEFRNFHAVVPKICWHIKTFLSGITDVCCHLLLCNTTVRCVVLFERIWWNEGKCNSTVCLLATCMLRRLQFKVVIEACEVVNPQTPSRCSGFALIYCTYYIQIGVTLQVFWWPPQCGWQHIKRKERVCVGGYAPVVLYKYTVHVFSTAVAGVELASLAINSLSHTHARTHA